VGFEVSGTATARSQFSLFAGCTASVCRRARRHDNSTPVDLLLRIERWLADLPRHGHNLLGVVDPYVDGLGSSPQAVATGLGKTR